jgi:hypothetical protein
MKKLSENRKYVALKKTDKDRKKKERRKVKLMATSDPELKASLRRKKAEEMKRYRQRKKLKAMTPVPCSSAVLLFLLPELSDTALLHGTGVIAFNFLIQHYYMALVS